MPKTISLQLSPEQASEPKIYIPIAAQLAGVKDTDVALAHVIKRSVDARRGAPKIHMSLELYMDNEAQPVPVHFDYPDVSGKTPVVIIGAGPTGLFAALRLIELGLRPILLERGKDVAERGKDIASINKNQGVNPDSNYAFGEGGAGAFSDGKLFTRSKKRGDHNKALQILVFHGADPEILYEAHPHVGTDRLPRIISNIRSTIEKCGGSIMFGTKATDIEVKNGKVIGVRCGEGLIEGAAVVIATGHSARDIYEILNTRKIALEAKPFAMGVRIEHPQRVIDSIQYRMPEGRGEYLPPASYSLASQENGRGVYSFCMCPGGFIVPAMTDASESVVNGMSPSLRNSPYANAGIVTEIRLSDFEFLRSEFGELAGLEFQRRFEQLAKRNGGDAQVAPAQRVADFIHDRPSKTIPATSYIPGIVSSEFSSWMPAFIAETLKSGIATFGRKMPGFVTNNAIIVGVESRTSSPVRIPRDPETLAHPQLSNLYPAGEGAGYSGGIVSSALDGERVAEAIARVTVK